jgi:hypothetical protein
MAAILYLLILKDSSHSNTCSPTTASKQHQKFTNYSKKYWKYDAGNDSILESFFICTPRQILLEQSGHSRVRWAAYIERVGGQLCTYEVFKEKPEGKRTQGTRKRK